MEPPEGVWRGHPELLVNPLDPYSVKWEEVGGER